LTNGSSISDNWGTEVTVVGAEAVFHYRTLILARNLALNLALLGLRQLLRHILNNVLNLSLLKLIYDLSFVHFWVPLNVFKAKLFVDKLVFAELDMGAIWVFELFENEIKPIIRLFVNLAAIFRLVLSEFVTNFNFFFQVI
jgi:hypothetical protein